MHEFSPEDACRWDAWQRANARSAQRSDRRCRIVGIVMCTATLVALAIAM
jgi:hypothetical protein